MLSYPVSGPGLVTVSAMDVKMEPAMAKATTDLGKPTMRGIRKCPKCGTYNGTRGLSCKNKTCDMVFKEADRSTKRSLCDAVRLYTGDTNSIYSVRLKDKGPDYRGFVQLATTDLGGSSSMIVSDQSQCYVDTCLRSSESDGHVTTLCAHVTACLGTSVLEATPVMLRHSAMNDLNIRPEIKHEVYSMAETTSGPLVQRVSRHVFCVKCDADTDRHPLGYLHMCFMEQRVKDGPAAVEHRFFCSCAQFRGEEWPSSALFPQWTAMDREREPEWLLKRCVHFYSCLCAFASDPKLREEFKMYIDIDQEICNRAAEQSSLEDNQVIAILGQDENGDTVQVEVVNQAELRGVFTENKSLVGDPLMNITEDIHIEMETPDGRVQTITVPATNITAQQQQTAAVARPGERRRQHSGRGAAAAPGGVSPAKKNCVSNPARIPGAGAEEVEVAVSFHQWLASVTERINQTMHYQFDGHPEPLVFHAPQVFFDCLRERISMGSKKKRLPNSTTAFVRKDALPLGTFTKYTWSITNVLHVKQIFDTPHLPLEITRTFMENKDGSFSVQSSPESEKEQFRNLPGKKIRAYELKTFLKVGQTTPEQKEPTPFMIEWIPDILPFMKIGELRIKFEYGHQRNGQLEQRIQSYVWIKAMKKRIVLVRKRTVEAKNEDFSNNVLLSMLGKLKCYVRLKKLNLIQFHHKVVRLKKCRIDVKLSACSDHIRQYNAKKIAEELAKLEVECQKREELILQSKNKTKKTRNSFLFHQSADNSRPRTPQEGFLNNFSLRPQWYNNRTIIHQTLAVCDDEVAQKSDTEEGDNEPSANEHIITSAIDAIDKDRLPINVDNVTEEAENEQISNSAIDEINHDDTIIRNLDKVVENCPPDHENAKECLRAGKRKLEDDDLIPVRSKRRLLNEEQILSELMKDEPSSSQQNLNRSLKVDVQKLSVSRSITYFSPIKSCQQELVACPDCPRTFVKAGHLRKHRRRVHKVQEEDGDDPDSHEIVDNEELSEGPTDNYCSPCKLPFSTPASLRKHEAVHHHKNTEESPGKEERRCGECSKQFQSSASLKRHILTEHRGVKSECPRCGQMVASSMARLDNHMAAVHESLAPCPYCSILLVPAHIPRHVRTVHLRFRQRCVLCDRFISNVYKHWVCVHKVDHTDHSACSCVTYSGPHGRQI